MIQSFLSCFMPNSGVTSVSAIRLQLRLVSFGSVVNGFRSAM